MEQEVHAGGSEDDQHMEEDEMNLIVTAPSLYVRPTYFRQTRKGKIFKTVSERYIRDDLGLGCHYVDDSDPNRRAKEAVVGRPCVIETESQLLNLLRPSTISSLVICDTNVLLHNMDVLEQSTVAMPNIVVPQTSLMECRSNQITAYDRTIEMLRSVGTQRRLVVFFADPHHVETAHVEQEGTTTTTSKVNDSATINDLNDMRIRNVAAFYGRHLNGTNTRVILLTDDAESRATAKKEQEDEQLYEAWTVRSWVRELEKKDATLSLSDLVAQYGGALSHAAGQSQVQEMCFSPHVDAKKLSLGVQSGLYHRGVLRSSSNTDAWVTIRRGDERVAVTIPGWEGRNRAVDGDVVAVGLNSVSEWMSSTTKEKTSDKTVGIASDTAEPTHGEMSNVPDTLSLDDTATKSLRPTGKVVGILRRNFTSYCGSIYAKATSTATLSTERDAIAAKCETEHLDGSMTCVFFPVDTKVPPILIRTTQRERLLGNRILVSMDSWPAHSPYPMGHYIRTIGLAGSKEVETQVLLQQHNIPHEPFPAKVLACLPPADYKIDNDNSPGREDLRHLPVLSIDPPGCKDIDDALHCIVLPNGNYQVGVHIADVTHYVKAGAAMDMEAANRSTSTYLVNRRLDMLPSLLTTDLCSLKGNVDRYAFSVLWEVTPEADIVDVDFKKTIIHSIGALTYQQAQSLIDEPKDDGSDIQVGAVKRLNSLAKKFRNRRIGAGALTLASPEVKFVLDSESLNPTDVQAYTLLEANALVEEFMLLANVTVSKKILRQYPTLSVLRRHPAPNRNMFDSLITKAKCRGFDIDIEDSKRLADSLDAAQSESDPYFNKLLRILSTRCMSPAQYFCSGEYKPTDWHHYGLAAPVYTHFTSPIRRYADVCVHRLLAAAIGVAPLPVHLSSKSYLHDLAANMNRRHRSAQLAGRASVQLHTLIFFSGEDGEKVEDAYVLDVETAEASEPSFTVMVPRYGIEGRVLLSNISASDPNLIREEDQHRLTYTNCGGKEKKSVSLQVFDKIRVRIWVREAREHQKELVLDLVEPQLGPNAGVATTSSSSSSSGKRASSSRGPPDSTQKKKKAKGQKRNARR